MYKTETHLHTREVSHCGRKRADEMVRLYKEAGYTTVFISDHCQESVLDSYGDLPWKDRVTLFFAGYYRAKCEGDKIGLTVLPAAEFGFSGKPNHYLAYGRIQEFLEAHPEVHKLDIAAFSKLAREYGLFLVQAHPCRDGYCYPTPEYVDGMEVCNSNPRHEIRDAEEEAVADAHGLYKIGGSDAHRDEDVGGSGVLTPQPVRTTEDFITFIKNGEAEVIRRSL